MSSLITRIGGERFTITFGAYGARGSFDLMGRDDNDMPFWLRSVYRSYEGQALSILMAATDAQKNQQNEDSWHYTNCEDIECARCEQFSRHLDRMYSDLRGQSMKHYVSRDAMRTARMRRLDRAVINCDICQNITGVCDTHSQQRMLLINRI